MHLRPWHHQSVSQFLLCTLGYTKKCCEGSTAPLILLCWVWMWIHRKTLLSSSPLVSSADILYESLNISCAWLQLGVASWWHGVLVAPGPFADNAVLCKLRHLSRIGCFLWSNTIVIDELASISHFKRLSVFLLPSDPFFLMNSACSTGQWGLNTSPRHTNVMGYVG